MRIAGGASKRSSVQRLRPEELRADVEPFPRSRDRLTPHDLHVVGELVPADRDPNGGDRPDLKPPTGFDQAS
jgi:hypothetical protein